MNIFINQKESYMKKISILVLATVLTVPAFAKSAPATNKKVTSESVATQTMENVAQNTKQTRNPKTKFPRGLQLGLGLSPTSGVNGFVGYNNKNFDSFWWKRLGVRFDFASYSPIRNTVNQKINDSMGEKGIEIEKDLHINDVALDANHYGAIVDFYPFGDTWFLGGWRLSGGYMTGKLNVDGKIHGENIGGNIEFELDGNKYYYTGGEMHGTADVNWKYSGPYLGTGFDLGLFWGFKIFMDAGVVFAGSSAQAGLDVPLDGLTDNNGTPITVPTSTSPQVVIDAYNAFMDAKDAELRKAQDELDKYKYFPLVKIGFMYRF